VTHRAHGPGVDAASPLTVLAVFVLVAAGVTALAVHFLSGNGPSVVTIQQVDDGGPGAFQVTSVHGDLQWTHLTVRFIDPAGVDRASLYLAVPQGPVAVGDQLAYRTAPPAGPYLLQVLDGSTELVRLAVNV
jgi:hypothetical protein